MRAEAVGPALRAEWGPDDARLGRRASSLFYCRTARCYIVLDLHRDRYLAFEAEAIEAGGGLAAHPLLYHAVGPPAIPLPATSVFESDAGRNAVSVSGSRILRFISSASWAAWRLKAGALEESVALVARRKRQSAARAPFDLERARALVDVFESLRPWFPRNYRCLFDSLALLDFLAAADLFPMWVFGVQEEPFEAHCWLQAGNVVLNDSLESVSAFTPIMAV